MPVLPATVPCPRSPRDVHQSPRDLHSSLGPRNRLKPWSHSQAVLSQPLHAPIRLQLPYFKPLKEPTRNSTPGQGSTGGKTNGGKVRKYFNACT